MLTILSPSKTLDTDLIDVDQYSQPQLLDQAGILARKMRRYNLKSLRDLLSISEDLAELNKERYEAFETPFTPDNAKPALMTFKGDSYTDFELEDYGAEDYAFAQDHLRILSGLYGVLRPLDLIQPYRLEMGTRLNTRRGSKLTDFWGDRITEALNSDFAEQDTPLLLNLASNQYMASVDKKKLDATIIDVDFRELRGGEAKFISFYAKRARGAMANYVIRNRVDDLEGVKTFDADGYAFSPERSSEDNLVFLRDQDDS